MDNREMTATLDRARKAYEAHDWQGAVTALQESDLDNAPDELLLLADALYWDGRFDESLDTFEKAFRTLVSEGRTADAGRVASLLAYLAFRRQTFAVGAGWLAQAQQLLDGEPQTIGHAWLMLVLMGKALFAEGDVGAALNLADEAISVAESVGSRSAQSLAMSLKAVASIQSGEWKAGLDLLDEANAMAFVGDDLRMTSDVYCNTISSCRNLGDYKRAGEWNEEAERWMRLNSVTGYTGACQVHRAELKRLHGSWLEAEDEARKACMELERFQITDYLGGAHYEIGEIRRRMGDLDSADLEFQRAYEQGHDAQPGRSLLLLDRGKTEAALRSIQAAYKWHEEDDNQSTERGPSRARLLPALIEIALASGDLELAERSVQELDVIAGAYESDVWKAAAESCRGALYLSRGEPDAAVGYLDRAWRMWRQLDLPYEMARARALLGEADRAAGDDVAATAEFKAAHATFQKLGAVGDAARLKTLIGVDGDDEESNITRVTRTFMFTDLVTSTDLIGLIGDSAWQDLLKWHDRTLRSAIDSAGGEVVRHTGDGFFASFADTRSGLDCAVDIQRRLAAHRKEAGFAPNLRIGLHRTEANRAGGDYSGGGIHLAARIGDHGSADEIVISSDTLGQGGTIPYPATPPVPVELKGIKDPVMLQTIDWR